MAQERSARPAEPPPNRLQRLRGAPRAVLAWVKQKPLKRSPLLTLPLLVISAVVGAWSLWRSPPEAYTGTMEQFQAALTEENFDQAEIIAGRLLRTTVGESLPQGLALYARGRRLGREARLRPDHESRRDSHRMAAGLLQQALDQGLPEDLWEAAILETADNLNRAQRYAESIRLLEDAVDAGALTETRLNRLLMEAYSGLPNPNWAKALEHLDRRLADAAALPQEREIASLKRAEMLLELNREDEARRELDALAGDRQSPPTRILLLRARLALREAERRRGEQNGGQAEFLQQAATWIKEIQQRDAIDRPERRSADYLEGLILRERGEFAKALSSLAAVHRIHFADHVGLAAGLHEAELLQHLGQDAESLESYRRLLAEIPSVGSFSNSWVSLDGFRARLLAAYARWLGQQKYAEAITLTRYLAQVFPAGRGLSLQAEARTEWAKKLSTDAETAPLGKRTEQEAAARKQFRLAGVAYARAAALRKSSGEYPDDIWRGAEAYLRGHDFQHAARMFQLYLSQESKSRRPDAQVFLGEALLSLGELDQALEQFRAAIVSDPEHPATYRARILAAQASIEQGNVAQTKAWLRGNLDNQQLAPQSLEWRDSLFLLGEMYCREAASLEAESRKIGVDSSDSTAAAAGLEKLRLSYEAARQASELLSEALERYPDAPQTIRGWYLLAEAHREAAKYPRKQRTTIALEVTRAGIEREMQWHLTRAVEAYERLIELLSGRERSEEILSPDPSGLNASEQAMLRNAYFGSADALFDLGRYEEAIRAYTLASNRYQNDPAALEAFVQIASCHRRMRRPAEAKGVLEQAKVVLARINPEVEFERTTRYGRKQWEELLNLLTAEWR